MSKTLLTDVKVVVGSATLSDHAFGVSIGDEREEVDVSGFSPTAVREFLPGAKDQSVTIRFLQDFAASSVHATLQPLYSGGSVFPFYVQPDSDSPSSTNPVYGGSASLYSYNGLDGDLNGRSEITAVFRPAGTAGFFWGTAAIT